MTKTTPYLLTALVLLGLCTPAQSSPAASPGCTASYDPTGPVYEVECRTTCQGGWNEVTVVGPGAVTAAMGCAGGGAQCTGVAACTAPLVMTASGPGICSGRAEGPTLRLYCHNVGAGQANSEAPPSEEQDCPPLLPASCRPPVLCQQIHGAEVPAEAVALAPFLAVPSVFVWSSGSDAFVLTRGPDGDCRFEAVQVAVSG